MKTLSVLLALSCFTGSVFAETAGVKHIMFKITATDVVALAESSDKLACETALKAIRGVRVKANLTSIRDKGWLLKRL